MSRHSRYGLFSPVVTTRGARGETKMKLWVAVSIGIVFIGLVSTGITFAILVTAWKDNVDALWNTASQTALTSVSLQIDAHLDAVEFAAKRVPLDPTLLLDYYVGYRQDLPTYHIIAFVFLGGGVGRPAAKYSWQIAEYYTCPQWGYFYSDVSIHPQFHGYCANTTTIDYSTLVYNGTDWGLKEEEKMLLNGTLKDVFLPIATIVGVPTLTYEVARGPYVSFADIDLSTLVTFLNTQVNVWNGQGRLVVRDLNTNEVIAGASGLDLSGWYMASFVTQRSGLQWETTVAVQNIYNNMQWRIGVACGIAVGVAVVFAAIAILLIYLCFRRTEQQHNVFATSLDDIKDFE
jgi:hypothetical protein